jgi:hypothetical protein
MLDSLLINAVLPHCSADNKAEMLADIALLKKILALFKSLRGKDLSDKVLFLRVQGHAGVPIDI